MKEEKEYLEKVIGRTITNCRQHWLRFSLQHTWNIQDKLGFKLDATLGFNDKPGFRNSSALISKAWLQYPKKQSEGLSFIPMILMDSHVFEYNSSSEQSRREKIDQVLDELVCCGGAASIIWHQRVFHSDYNWGPEYVYLLDQIDKKQIEILKPT